MNKPTELEAQVNQAQAWGKDKDPSDIPPRLQKYVPMVQHSILVNSHLYFTLLHDSSVIFIPGVGFSSDLKTGVVRIGTEDYPTAEKLGIIGTPEFEAMQCYSVCHELGHVRDLKENPKACLGNLEYLEQKAKGIAPQVLDIIRNNIGSVPNYLTKQIPVASSSTRFMSNIELFLYKQLFDLYNSLDDIYINRDIPNHAAKFSGSARQAPYRLYRDFLFPTNPGKPGSPPRELEAADYESMPQSAQLINYLLRKAMVPDQEILISPEVREALSGFADRVAESLGITLEEEVQSITSPANSRAKDPDWRNERIRQTIEEVFIQFLLKDLKEFSPPTEEDLNKMIAQMQNGDQEDAGAESEGQPGSPWNILPAHHSGPPNIDKLKEFIRSQDEKAQAGEDKQKEEERKGRLTPDERAQEAQAKADRKICEEFDVDPKFAEEYRELSSSVEPYKKDLSQAFEAVMQTIQQRISTFWTEGFRSGRFNIERFIRKYGPDLATDRVDLIPWEILDIYDQREIISKLVLWPDKLSLRVVLDGSTSMNAERILAVKQLAVLFVEALSTFESTINLRFRPKDPLIVATEIWMYGSNGQAIVVKPFAKDQPNPWAELADRFKAIGKINNGYGGTCEGEPLWSIASSITPEYEADLKKGKARDILFEVTDGETNEVSSAGKNLVKDLPEKEPIIHKGRSVVINKQAAQDSRNALAALEAKGVIPRAFQIGDLTEKEQATFNSVWGLNGTHTPHPKDVTPAAAQMLASEILKTEFIIEYYEEEE